MAKTSTIAVLVIVIIIVIVGIWLAYKNPQPAAVSSSGENSATAPDQNNNPTSYDVQGMKIEILQEGTGEVTKAGDTVTVNYVGTLEDGTKFDSSIDRGQPFEFILGQNSVIQGWELGVLGMKVGEKRRLTIPPELAYGSTGAGGIIPSNATLIFEVDLLGIK